MRLAAADALDIGPQEPWATGPSSSSTPTTRSSSARAHPRCSRSSRAGTDNVLTLTFPDGREVAEILEPGEPATTANYEGRPVAGRLVEGELAAALSEHLQRPVRLLARDPTERGADDAPVTLMSQASLDALGVPDARRFRMTITIDGVDAWEEHGWGGRELAVGEAVLRVTEPVPRCAVTTRDPDSGRRDAPTLKAIAELRGKDDVTFGVWCEVVVPGRVRVGDAVASA